MQVFSKAPNVVVVCATVIVGLTIAGVILLIALGRSSEELTHLVQYILQSLGAVSGGGALLYAAASAKSGENVEKELNGRFDARVRTAVMRALRDNAREGENGQAD